MNREDCYQAGYLGKPHGIRGQIKGVFEVNDLKDYVSRNTVYLLLGDSLKVFTLISFQLTGAKQAILQFEGIENRDQAEKLSGAGLFYPLDQLPKLSGGKFYYHEITGFTLVDKNLGNLGFIIRVDEMPAQDLIMVDIGGREIPVPITDEIVIGPDREKRILACDLPAGYLEEMLTNP